MVGTSGNEIGRVGLLGRAVRAPGAPSAAHLFSLAASGGDSLLQVPGMRWSTGACAPSNAMCTSCRHGGFVPGAQRFDHVRFEISPSEARAMDPQQRLLLEVAYSSTHDAELRRSDLISCDAGVFVGIMNTDFEKLLAGPPSILSDQLPRFLDAEDERLHKGAMIQAVPNPWLYRGHPLTNQ